MFQFFLTQVRTTTETRSCLPHGALVALARTLISAASLFLLNRRLRANPHHDDDVNTIHQAYPAALPRNDERSGASTSISQTTLTPNTPCNVPMAGFLSSSSMRPAYPLLPLPVFQTFQFVETLVEHQSIVWTIIDESITNFSCRVEPT